MSTFSTFDHERARESAVSAAGAVCHLESLLDRCLGDASLAARLWRRFDERLLNSVGQIVRALDESNHADALRRVHSLKGEAASLAAHRLQHAAIELENALKREPAADEQEQRRLLLRLCTAADQCHSFVPQVLEAITSALASTTSDP